MNIQRPNTENHLFLNCRQALTKIKHLPICLSIDFEFDLLLVIGFLNEFLFPIMKSKKKLFLYLKVLKLFVHLKRLNTRCQSKDLIFFSL